jgi:SAM-dependent methyltransferase
MEGLERVYSTRFDARDRDKKDRLWQTLCEVFLQQFVHAEDRVLDLGAGYCEFINHIQCASKYAVDLSVDTQRFAEPEVRVYQVPSFDMPMIASESLDVVFCSNFLEHLPTKEALFHTLSEVCRVLRPAGRFIVLQPNIKYALREYWDFIDHRLPLSHLSMEEALINGGFQIDKLFPRFLPNTTKSRIPQTDWLLRFYLAVPLLWRLLGKQMFIVAHKSSR